MISKQFLEDLVKKIWSKIKAFPASSIFATYSLLLCIDSPNLAPDVRSETGKFSLVNSAKQAFGIRNTAKTIGI